MFKRVTKSQSVLLEENGKFIEFGPKIARIEIDEHFSYVRY
jgi:hypothetical protein